MSEGPDGLDEDDYFRASKQRADEAFHDPANQVASIIGQDEAEKPRICTKLDVGFLYATNDVNDPDPQVAQIVSLHSVKLGGGEDQKEQVQPYIVHELQVIMFAVNALLTFCDDDNLELAITRLTELAIERRQIKNDTPKRDSSAFAMDMLRLMEDLKNL